MSQHNPRSRRAFLQAATAAAAWRSLGLAVPYARYLPIGLMPVVATAAGEDILASLGKPGLKLLGDRPINAETPAHLLDDAVTPASRLFVRNNGVPPESVGDPDLWELRVHGEACLKPQTLTLAELKRQFRPVTLQLQLECAGNGRGEFRPRTSGNQWTTGAIGCPEWTGVRLADVLTHCGVAGNAVYVAYKGADTHLSGDANKSPISRGAPVAKAMEKESLLAFAMNGAPIPPVHGAPLRLVVSGWPASVSGKWLRELLVRDRVHDGEKMDEGSYRMPCKPVAPGAKVPNDEMCIIGSLPVKSLITFPESGRSVALGTPVALRGHAWAGDRAVKRVDVSTDFGATWQTTRLKAPVNRLAWQHFDTELKFSQPGYYEVWARATDTAGHAQPMLVPGWNPKGYLNNACHRIAVQVV
ncbi:MAG: sulfite oxidase [Proteobacteria bacterium]|nr:sulfite oxidase [Pseudomonadota bacterium]